MIYLDHNATTPVDEQVLSSMLPYLKNYYGNPSSLYRFGRLASSAINTAREQVAALAGTPISSIIFTSGGTEANNLALATLAPNSSLAISAIEHPSVTEPALNFKKKGGRLAIIEVNADGQVTQDAIDNIIAQKPDLVSIMLANNETGVVQHVAEYTEQLRAHGINVHTDAVQALGKVRLDFKQLGVQLMTLSSHKIYGPKGAGALVFEKGITINPLLLGGGQEQALRAGTENVAAIVGFGKAAELAKSELSLRREKLLKLRAQLEQGLKTLPNLTIFAEHAPRLPNTVQFGIEGMDGEMLLMNLDKNNIAVSSGSACASGEIEPSAVLLAMGVSPGQAKTAVRVSLGTANTEAEITKFIHQLKTYIPPA